MKFLDDSECGYLFHISHTKKNWNNKSKMQMQFIEGCTLIDQSSYTIDAPHSLHGGTFVDASALDTAGGWVGVIVGDFGGKATHFSIDTSDFGSCWLTISLLLDSSIPRNWLGVWERDKADAAPPTAWLAVQ